MQVKLSKSVDNSYIDYNVNHRVVCELNGSTVEIRQTTDGKCMLVVIQNGTHNHVVMESRAAAIWLIVKTED